MGTAFLASRCARATGRLHPVAAARAAAAHPYGSPRPLLQRPATLLLPLAALLPRLLLLARLSW